MSAEIKLHSRMTAQQIAEWCARNRMFVVIDYTTGADGMLMPLISARRELPTDHTSTFLRRQAE